MKRILKKIIPKFIISWYHLLLAFLGACLYGFPSKKIKVIGVTGTKGKSTVVDMTTRILEEAGNNVASISSVRFKAGDDIKKNKLKMTMPGRFKIQRFLKKAVKKGATHFVLEVTSEGILQHRHKFIKFDTVVFTNISPEHIERHGSFTAYRKAKEKLFKVCKKNHVLNLDDKQVGHFLRHPAEKKIGFSISGAPHTIANIYSKVIPEYINIDGFSSDFRVDQTTFHLDLLGRFNIENALASICVADIYNIDRETSKRALGEIREVSGRMEVVSENPLVIVDYAHTADSLEKVYEALEEIKEDGKLICVLGSAGGGRDRWKRPTIGKVADNHCDEIILTDEDPYDEDPLSIIEDVSKGISKEFNRTLDRKDAIESALRMAREKDIVAITGKGSEPWMCVKGGKKIAWDDRETVREKLKKIKGE